MSHISFDRNLIETFRFIVFLLFLKPLHSTIVWGSCAWQKCLFMKVMQISQRASNTNQYCQNWELMEKWWQKIYAFKINIGLLLEINSIFGNKVFKHFLQWKGFVEQIPINMPDLNSFLLIPTFMNSSNLKIEWKQSFIRQVVVAIKSNDSTQNLLY